MIVCIISHMVYTLLFSKVKTMKEAKLLTSIWNNRNFLDVVEVLPLIMRLICENWLGLLFYSSGLTKALKSLSATRLVSTLLYHPHSLLCQIYSGLRMKFLQILVHYTKIEVLKSSNLRKMNRELGLCTSQAA